MSPILLMDILAFLLFGLLVVPPFWKFIGRSGWHPALAFLMIVPLVNLILLWVVAFKKWPTDNISGEFKS